MSAMATKVEPVTLPHPRALRVPRSAKFLRDVMSVLEMKLLLMRRGWYWFLLSSLVFPVGMFYWFGGVASDDPAAVRRVMVGAMVFAVSMGTIGTLAQQMIQDRFQGRWKLLITMPVSKVAYSAGVLAFATLLSAGTVAVLLGFAWVADVELNVSWVFFPVTAAAVLSMAGLPLLIVSSAPSAEAGSVMTNLVGILPVMISPVFFTMDQAPKGLELLGWVSPVRYAADGLSKSLSGQTDVWTEFGVLAGFALVTIALGLWKLRWREA